jgi:hypothetical protein
VNANTYAGWDVDLLAAEIDVGNGNANGFRLRYETGALDS